MITYEQFIERKSQIGGQSGFEPVWMIGSEIAVNGAWKAKVREWHQQEMPAVKS